MSVRIISPFRSGARATVGGTTNNPTRGVNTFALLPEMTATITTSGGDVLVNSQCTISIQNGDNSELALFVDGAEYLPNTTRSRNQVAGLIGATNAQPCPVVTLVTGLAAGPHTFEIHWRAVAGTARADQTYRRLTVLEVF